MTSSGYDDLINFTGDHIPELQLPEAVLEEREELGSLQYFHESRTMAPPPGRTTPRPTGMSIMKSDEWRGVANVAIGENTRGFQSPREIATRDLDGVVPVFHRPIKVFSPQLMDSEVSRRGPHISPASWHRWSSVEQHMEEEKKEIYCREGARSRVRGSPKEEGKERRNGGGKV